MDDLVGQKLGPYEIRECIGSGGMATVYKAYHPALERLVAIKVLSPELARDTAFLERFKREARIIASLRHPHIVPVYDLQWEQEPIYIVMDYIEGGSLKDRLGKPLDLNFLLRVVIEVADALCYAHQEGIVHRDVKPGNILLDKRERAYLSDFGLAKQLMVDSELTQKGTLMGTLDYMAPEQARGLEVDARSDIYALGATLYEMATGCIPFEAETPFQVIAKHISEPVRPPREVNPGLPKALEKVILRAMAKEPSERYREACEMREELERIPPLSRSLQSRTDVLFDQGEGYFKEEKWLQAYRSFGRVLELEPNHGEALARQEQIREKLYEEGVRALRLGGLAEAVEKLKELVRIDGGYRDALGQLEEARKQLNLELLYTEGSSYFERGMWAEAVRKFEEVVCLEEKYRDAPARLREAERQERLAKSYERGGRYFEQGNWAGAIREFEGIVNEEPAYRDARERLEEARKQQRLEELYRQGEDCYQQEKWDEAIRAFEAVQELDAGYRDVRKKLKEAKRQKRLNELYERAIWLEETGRWEEAYKKFCEIMAESREYKDVPERLPRVKKRRDLVRLQRDAERLEGEGKLEDVVAKLEEAVAIGRQRGVLDWSGRRELDRRLRAVRRKLRYQEAKLREGKAAYETQNWSNAREAFQKVLEVNPKHGEARQLMEETEARQAGEQPVQSRSQIQDGQAIWRGWGKTVLEILVSTILSGVASQFLGAFYEWSTFRKVCLIIAVALAVLLSSLIRRYWRRGP